MSIDAPTRNQLIEIVRAAGREIVMPSFRQFEALDVQQKSSPTDLVTLADQACEAFIAGKIAEQFPDWVIVGEESVEDAPDLIHAVGEADTCVFIDPIDGTWNYAYGLSNFGTIIAVVENGITQFGLLYDPDHDDWVFAHKGQGAFYQKPGQSPTALAMQHETDVKKMIGLLSLHGFQGEQQAHLALSASRFQRFLSLASCHAYRHMALGLFHFNLNYKMMPWDHAAGVLVHTELGGVARTLDGRDYVPTETEGQLLVAQSDEQWQTVAAILRHESL